MSDRHNGWLNLTPEEDWEKRQVPDLWFGPTLGSALKGILSYLSIPNHLWRRRIRKRFTPQQLSEADAVHARYRNMVGENGFPGWRNILERAIWIWRSRSRGMPCPLHPGHFDRELDLGAPMYRGFVPRTCSECWKEFVKTHVGE